MLRGLVAFQRPLPPTPAHLADARGEVWSLAAFGGLASFAAYFCKEVRPIPLPHGLAVFFANLDKEVSPYDSLAALPPRLASSVPAAGSRLFGILVPPCTA